MGFLKWGWFTDPTIWYITPESGVGQFLKGIGLGGLTTPYGGYLAGDDLGGAGRYLADVAAIPWPCTWPACAAIPDELREAARVDGASEWQVLRHIMLPMLQPITLSAVIILGHISLEDLRPGRRHDRPRPRLCHRRAGLLHVGHHLPRQSIFPGAAIAIVLLVMVAVLIIPYLAYSIRTEAEV